MAIWRMRTRRLTQRSAGLGERGVAGEGKPRIEMMEKMLLL